MSETKSGQPDDADDEGDQDCWTYKVGFSCSSVVKATSLGRGVSSKGTETDSLGDFNAGSGKSCLGLLGTTLRPFGPSNCIKPRGSADWKLVVVFNKNQQSPLLASSSRSSTIYCCSVPALVGASMVPEKSACNARKSKCLPETFRQTVLFSLFSVKWQTQQTCP